MIFTFDTGMLIALERRKRNATDALRAIVRRGLVPVVPAVVYVEWWRGRSDVREEILGFVALEPMPAALCRAAGEALAATKATFVDAVVMASAALRGGGVVYTSAPDDLLQLQGRFPTVRILPI